jgi:hypothetical protein
MDAISPPAIALKSKAPEAPPPVPMLIFDLLFLQGVLDAVDVSLLACCSWELCKKTHDFWEGVRAGNPATRLHLIERLVDDPAQNDTRYPEYVPLSAAGRCVVCGLMTRFQYPVEGSMLCAPCGKKFDNASYRSLIRFAMVSETNAKKNLWPCVRGRSRQAPAVFCSPGVDQGSKGYMQLVLRWFRARVWERRCNRAERT